MSPRIDAEKKLDAARGMRELIARHRNAIEEERKLPRPVLDALGQLGVFRALVPAAAGGQEWDLLTWLRVVEELSRYDASVGWNAGVGASAGSIITGWLSEHAARRVTTADPNGVTAGAGAPQGRARVVEGGYVLNGRWQFASGISHAGFVLAGFALEDEVPRLGRIAFLPVADVEVIDTWFVGGLRGTASHDFAVHDRFIPSDLSVHVIDEPPVHEGPLYRLPVGFTLGAALGPLALGIARGAIDTFVEVVGAKVDRFSGARMTDRMTVQERVARAEAIVRSARAYYYDTTEEIWGVVCNGREPDQQERALAKLALVTAVESGARAVDIVYRAAGTSAIFTSNPLERFFRDIHVATQHRFGSAEEIYQVGAVLLGVGELPPAPPRRE